MFFTRSFTAENILTVFVVKMPKKSFRSSQLASLWYQQATTTRLCGYTGNIRYLKL